MPSTLRNHQYLTSYVADRVCLIVEQFKSFVASTKTVTGILRQMRKVCLRHIKQDKSDPAEALAQISPLLSRAQAESSVLECRAGPFVESAQNYSEQVSGSAAVMGCYESDERYVSSILEAVRTQVSKID